MLKTSYLATVDLTMDLNAFWFASRGHCKKINNSTMLQNEAILVSVTTCKTFFFKFESLA